MTTPIPRRLVFLCALVRAMKIQKSAINYDIHAHTFEAIPPSKTLDFQAMGGMSHWGTKRTKA